MNWNRTPEAQKQLTPEQAITLLKNGNARFVSQNLSYKNLKNQVERGSDGQYPFAVILGCIDSRVPAEIVFDLGIGDIFNVRIAGNTINNDILGSIEYGCKVAGSKLVMVLGHTFCGAVKGAIDKVELGHITELVNKVIPAINQMTHPKPKPEAGNEFATYVNRVAEFNVKNSINEMRQKSDILREMENDGDIKIIGGMYDVSFGAVTFYE